MQGKFKKSWGKGIRMNDNACTLLFAYLSRIENYVLNRNQNSVMRKYEASYVTIFIGRVKQHLLQYVDIKCLQKVDNEIYLTYNI